MRHLAVALAFVLPLVACRGPAPAAEDAGVPLPVAVTPVNAAPATPGPNAAPPIDCPLHAAGVHAEHMKPFEEVEKYIAFLERPDRALWQKPDEVVEALRLGPTDTVADVGAGSGYFTFRMAKALPRGTVVAIDIEPEMVRHIHHKAMTEGVANVRAVLDKPDEPTLPPEADVVFVCDVLHHVAQREAWLGKLAAQMKPSARLVLVEFKEGPLPQGPPASLKLSRAQMLDLARGAGLTLTAEQPTLLPYQTYLVFQRAAAR
jgi:SAM-dependent methyltransferase